MKKDSATSLFLFAGVIAMLSLVKNRKVNPSGKVSGISRRLLAAAPYATSLDRKWVDEHNVDFSDYVDAFFDGEAREPYRLSVLPDRMSIIRDLFRMIWKSPCLEIMNVYIEQRDLHHIFSMHSVCGKKRDKKPMSIADLKVIPYVINFGAVYEGWDDRRDVPEKKCLRFEYENRFDMIVNILPDEYEDARYPGLTDKKNLELVTSYKKD